MYVDPNFKTKKAMKEAVAAGKKVEVYSPAGLFSGPLTGEFSVEGPHYPKPHTWYARVKVVEGIVEKVIS